MESAHEAAYPKSNGARRRAAQYVRMSTEHQKYSTDNQTAAIRRYATQLGIEIVRTYADEGKSGLRLDGRRGLKRLIEDAEGKRTDFTEILVYDVSRWGRFQDADESAYYEYLCKRAGLTVHYCEEQFENDGSPISAIVKGVKRAMAGEYSRELSAKVFVGQCRLIERGFRQGGFAGYGLRRMLIDQSGKRKFELASGEHKSIQTDRVILTPGPPEEVEVVRWIYQTFVSADITETEIAKQLNARGIHTHVGTPWNREIVHRVLISEKYVGNNVWNRTSFKLRTKLVPNRRDVWIRADGAFEPVVDLQLFKAAQAVLYHRLHKLSDEELLAALRNLLKRRGYLTAPIIDEADDVPSSRTYRTRFGHLLRAYELIGYTPLRNFSYVEVDRFLRRRHPEIVSNIVTAIEQSGGHVVRDSMNDLLTINEECTASVLLIRCSPARTGALRWDVRLDARQMTDLVIVVRMKQSNLDVLDYYLLPRVVIASDHLRLNEDRNISLDAYRVVSLDPLFKLLEQSKLSEFA